ncbi:hypothetical protein [Pararhizobium sp.]|uniref:hypothetical protein n=1 Tax=Pararhizobium sp. TaxID=1977563 RepID=UPI00271F6C61|nr:hypothetical protein [Pararhizobium sp.]MDO9418319.1 hypothetical protein [Pararhizobium sp.]
MLYWIPRLFAAVAAALVIGLGILPATADGLANTMLVVLLGLGLFSLTVHIFPPEKF